MNNIWISDKILRFINLKSQIPNIFPKSQIPNNFTPQTIPKFLTPQIPNPKYHNTPPVYVSNEYMYMYVGLCIVYRSIVY